MAMVDWQPATSQEWDAARDLVADLEEGMGLPELETTLRLRDGEVLHAELDANCWWYCSADVTYQKGHALLFGGLGSLAFTAAASAYGNHRRRRHAEKLAAPQWRPVGNVPVLLTSDRILLPVDDALTSIWLDDIIDITPQPQAQRLKVVAEDLQPLEVHGPWVPYLCIALQFLGANPASYLPLKKLMRVAVDPAEMVVGRASGRGDVSGRGTGRVDGVGVRS